MATTPIGLPNNDDTAVILSKDNYLIKIEGLAQYVGTSNVGAEFAVLNADGTFGLGSQKDADSIAYAAKEVVIGDNLKSKVTSFKLNAVTYANVKHKLYYKDGIYFNIDTYGKCQMADKTSTTGSKKECSGEIEFKTFTDYGLLVVKKNPVYLRKTDAISLLDGMKEVFPSLKDDAVYLPDVEGEVTAMKITISEKIKADVTYEKESLVIKCKKDSGDGDLLADCKIEKTEAYLKYGSNYFYDVVNKKFVSNAKLVKKEDGSLAIDGDANFKIEPVTASSNQTAMIIGIVCAVVGVVVIAGIVLKFQKKKQ